MATLQQLVDAIAAIEGIDPERLGALARAIREAGLIATGGRGTSAAQMTEKDAANLLIAANSADTARTAPEIVRRYRALQARAADHVSEFGVEFENLLLAAKMRRIPNYLVNLIRRFGKKRSPLGRQIYPTQRYGLRIEFEKPTCETIISVHAHLTRVPDFINFQGDEIGRSDVDRLERTTITERTIFTVGQLLRT